MNIESLLPWSEPSPTDKAGEFIREGQPGKAFWDAWKADKGGLKAAGVACFPFQGGWVATWVNNQGPSVNYPTLVESSPAFVPAPLRLPDGVVLSDEQTSIVSVFRDGKGNIVVKARAGSGKTFTITVSISQAPENKILYAVFGKKNEREAVEKITDSRVMTTTLHALGLKFVKRIWPNVKADKFVEYDRIDQLFSALPDEVRNTLFKLVGFAKNSFISPSVSDLIDICESRDLDCENFEEDNQGGWTLTKLATSALRVLEISKIRDSQNRISFNDMVWLPVAMNWVRPWFELVVIDEAQDMNMPQLQMARSASKGRVIVVGDDRQAIYGFRGAVSDGLGIMQTCLDAQVLGLTVTRRCAKKIVALAQKIVPDYQAHPDAPEGEIDEVSKDAVFEQVKIGDAILSRANAPLMPICLSLLRKGVSARIEGRDIGKLLLDIVKKLKARSVPDFIGKAESWGDRMKNRMSKSKNAEAKCEQIDDQVATLIALAEGVANVKEIETRCIDLFQDSDKQPKPAVVLSSVHKAKGLEWNRVFLIDHTFKVWEGEGEEANIAYVAITRARTHLTFIK